MMKPTSERVAMSQTPDLGPLTLTQEGDRWRFTLTTPSEMMLELPSDYERFLTERLEPMLRASALPPIEMDLRGLPAISSRQLGLMLALQRALADRCEKLCVTGLSDGVRRLLNLTRTEQFFRIS
jgi:anti-anti-sigma regulatory factor